MVITRSLGGKTSTGSARSTTNSRNAGNGDHRQLEIFLNSRQGATQSKRNASNTSGDNNSHDQNGIPGSIVESRIVKFSNLLPIGKKIDCPVYGYIFKENPILLGNM